MTWMALETSNVYVPQEEHQFQNETYALSVVPIDY